jgi:hypothetical protein
MKFRGLVALAAGAVFLASAGPAAAAQTFADPAGDQQGTAPDVTTVVASNDAKGQIELRITVSNHPALATDSELFVLFDTDRNGATGATNALGAEYFFYIDGSDRTYGLGRWTGTEFDFSAPTNTAEVSYDAGVAVISINKGELGNTAGFNFWVRGIQHTGPDTSNLDDAPDDGVYTYALTAAPKVRLGPLVLVVGQPRAGRTWSVKVKWVRVIGTSQLVVPDKVTCRATLGGRSFRGKGKGGCTFTIPADARGKRLTVRITVNVGTVSRTYVQRFTVV